MSSAAAFPCQKSRKTYRSGFAIPSQSGMTYLRIVIPLYLFEHDLSENRYPLFRIML
jgi:hypothetical protein